MKRPLEASAPHVAEAPQPPMSLEEALRAIEALGQRGDVSDDAD